LRTRLDLLASMDDDLAAFIQIQDVRLWGSESNTLLDFSANGLDIHQAYVDLVKAEDGGFMGRFGRQEVNFGGQRLVGAVNWTQQARAFDGIRVGTGGSVGHFDVFAAKLADEVLIRALESPGRDRPGASFVSGASGDSPQVP
jgi:hypothetical protein